MNWEEVWQSESFQNKLTRAVLTPASAAYTLGWQTYLSVYKLGLKKPKAPHRPIVCVGNLQVGGTGKTPATIFLASLIQVMGKAVVISASGYGSEASRSAALAPEGSLKASQWGDEPALLRRALPNVPLVIGRDRVRAAEIVEEMAPNAVMLMDDGFQHLPLAKTCTIVLDPPEPPNKRCLPAGPYREPRPNRRRADLVLPDRFRCEPEQLRLKDPGERPAAMPEQFAVLCAIANPSRFINALRSLSGSNAVQEIALPDHDSLSAGNLIARLPRDVPTIVTEKDWVKLRERDDVRERPILIADYRVSIEPLPEFKQWLEPYLNDC